MTVRGPDLRRNRRRESNERTIRRTLFVCALLSILTTIGIIAVLFTEAVRFFTSVGIFEFLLGTKWTPQFEPQSFGVLPLVCGTFLIVAGASVIAMPLGLASAIYLAEFASDRFRRTLKPVLEILAGVPTIVYGYFALTFVTPLLANVFPSIQVYNAASASIVVAIMVLPMIVSLCDDALRAVPNSLREGAYALGATPMEVSTRISVPAALSGVVASFVLAFSRAIGETMAVSLAAGNTPNLTVNPLESIQTMTSYIVQISMGDTPSGTISYYTIFAVGALLFLITLGSNVVANRVLRRYREVYE